MMKVGRMFVARAVAHRRWRREYEQLALAPRTRGESKYILAGGSSTGRLVGENGLNASPADTKEGRTSMKVVLLRVFCDPTQRRASDDASQRFEG